MCAPYSFAIPPAPEPPPPGGDRSWEKYRLRSEPWAPPPDLPWLVRHPNWATVIVVLGVSAGVALMVLGFLAIRWAMS